MVSKLKFYASIVVLLSVATTVKSDDFAGNAVAEFITNSLNNWVTVSDTLQVNGTASPSFLDDTGLFTMKGSLRNIEIEGRSRVRNILVKVYSLVDEGWGSYDYSFDMDTIKIVGDYNMSGSVGSVVPLSNEGRFEIQLVEPIQMFCNVLLFSEGGYLKQERCFVQGFNFTVNEARVDFIGLAESSNSTRLDDLLVADVYARIAKVLEIYGLRSLIRDALEASVMNYIQVDLDTKKLLDIISGGNRLNAANTNKLAQSNILKLNESADKNALASTAIKDRVEYFLDEKLKEFAGVHADPVTFNGTLSIDKRQSVLFPVNATFTELRYSGLSRLSDTNGHLIGDYGGAELGFEFIMTDLIITGIYAMDGKVANNIPINNNGEFEFSLLGKCQVVVHGQGENQNGNLVWIRNTMTLLSCLSNEPVLRFSPSPLDGTGLTEQVSGLIISSVADSLKSTVQYFVSIDIANQVVGYLQSQFNITPVIDIITETSNF